MTEMAKNDASEPTMKNIWRMHLMGSILMALVGVPMLAEVQGICEVSTETFAIRYQHGALNDLEYGDLANHARRHDFFKR